jgi:hypothetical protein
MKLLVVFALLLSACVGPYTPDPTYARDEMYCWHLKADGTWHVVNFSDRCPPNAMVMEHAVR